MLYRILCFIVIIIRSAILSIIYCEIVVIDYLNVSVSLWFVPYLFRSLLILAQFCAGTERTKCYRNAPITTWPPNSPLPHAHCPWNTEQSLTNIDRGPPQCECISSTIKPKCDIRSSRLIDTLNSTISARYSSTKTRLYSHIRLEKFFGKIIAKKRRQERNSNKTKYKQYQRTIFFDYFSLNASISQHLYFQNNANLWKIDNFIKVMNTIFIMNEYFFTEHLS